MKAIKQALVRISNIAKTKKKAAIISSVILQQEQNTAQKKFISKTVDIFVVLQWHIQIRQRCNIKPNIEDVHQAIWSILWGNQSSHLLLQA